MTQAQGEYSDLILEKLASQYRERINESKIMLQEAELLFSEAQKLQLSSEYKSAEKRHSQSSKLFIEGYRNIYFAYRDNIKNFSEQEKDSSKQSTMQKLQELSSNYMRESITYRKDADFADEDSTKCRFFALAHESEKQALACQEKSLAVYFSMSEYRYKAGDSKFKYKTDDETNGFDESFFAINPDSEQYSNFAENAGDTSSYDNNTAVNNAYNNNSNNNNGNNNNNNTNGNSNYTGQNNYYRVQIASSTKVLSNADLRKIYNGPNDIVSEKYKGTYKYLTGKYENYEQALSAKNASGVNSSFIVEYRNGTRVELNNGNTYVAGNSSGAGEEYRIQIGVSRIPAYREQLKKLNPTNLPVQTYKSVHFYKYTIGNFSSYSEAVNFRNANGLADTFVVKYKNGSEIPL